MKKKISVILSVIMAFALVMINVMLFPASTTAAEYTFIGTITDQTNSEILYLDTNGGVVAIKYDSSTELDDAKFLLPGNPLTAKCYSGSDEYWHASKFTGSSSSGTLSIDSSSKATVSGTIAKGTTQELLYLVVSNGTMQIKIDSSTELDGVRYLTIGRNIQVVCARGSDAYMHALSISDGNGTVTSSATSYSSSSSVVSTSSGTSVTGTVEKGTTASLLYLTTSAGTMQIVLDLGTDASSCRALIPGQKVTVNFYRGSDAWNHSSKIVNNSSSAASTTSLDSSTKATVSGTITGDTTEETLHLNTSSGVMQIRLDSDTNFSRCPVLLLDKSVQVVCERGSDGYYHALQINAN